MFNRCTIRAVPPSQCGLNTLRRLLIDLDTRAAPVKFGPLDGKTMLSLGVMGLYDGVVIVSLIWVNEVPTAVETSSGISKF